VNAALSAWLFALGPEAGVAALLLLAFVLGAAVGIERGLSTSAVGIRTCTLVALASAAFAFLITQRVPQENWGAGFGAVATGVGFLGAGAILRGAGGRKVTGLGNAGTIWCVAMLGLLTGAQEFTAALVVAALVLAINMVMRPVAAWIDRHRARMKPEDDVLDG
jgi:putative Mg2+ transporter-C (MgtC) family protein